jgi:regulator of nucleoside diphosphate kinase
MTPITVTTIDRARLLQLIDCFLLRRESQVVSFLEREIARANVVSPQRVAPNIATMHSRVRYRDHARDTSFITTLVYPADSDSHLGRISILNPTATALLGLSAGKSLEWRSLDGRPRAVTLEQVIYQPEAVCRFEP